MNAPSHFRLLAAASFLLLAGCTTPLRPQDTAVYYHPSSAAKYTPKPKDYDVPILTYPPKRKYEVIGRFTMREKFYGVEDGYVFMNCAAEYNARQAGADAIIVLERWQDHTHRHYYYAETDTDGGEGTDIETRGYILFDAEMIVYR
jgi:hypothetical protein